MSREATGQLLLSSAVSRASCLSLSLLPTIRLLATSHSTLGLYPLRHTASGKQLPNGQRFSCSEEGCTNGLSVRILMKFY